MPERRVPGRMYPSGHANEAVHAVTMVLEDWFLAMEEGTVAYRLPDLTYQRSRGRPTWTEEELERLMRDIDEEIDREVPRAPGVSTGSKLGPGFSRLAVPQRLALAQQLDAVLQKHDTEFPPERQPSNLMARLQRWISGHQRRS